MPSPIGTIGLGFVAPDPAMLQAAGAGGVSDTTLGCLQQMVRSMQVIQSRLAPQPVMIEVPVDGIAVGTTTQPIVTNAPSFNGFLVDVRTGTFRVFLSGSPTGMKFLDLPSADIPYHVFFPSQTTGQLIFKNIHASQEGSGQIYIMSY